MPVLLLAAGLLLSSNFLLNFQEHFEALTSKSKLSFPADYQFESFDRLLARYVKNGLVDYSSLSKDPDLTKAYDELKVTSPRKLKGKLEALSFWVNTYNFLTIKSIADKYPVKMLGTDYSTRKFIVGSELFSLSQIKTEILPELILSSDWRAIFLLCDGCLSSPEIKNHAYSPSSITDEFEPSLKRFVLNEANYALNEKNRIFSISPFYMWNIRYFKESSLSPFELVNSYFPPEKRINLDAVSHTYLLSYDRRINDLASSQKESMRANEHQNQNQNQNKLKNDIDIDSKASKQE